MNNGRDRGEVSGVFLIQRARATELEAAAIEEVEARLERGEVDPAAADRELLEIALRRFAHLSPEAIEELRQVGLELLEEPEMVETRSLAPSPTNPRRGEL